jgi:hypothetical protein
MKIKEAFYTDGERLAVEDIPTEYWLERYRNWRSGELLSTDWTQLPDAPVDTAAYATYRQALRDLPSAKDFTNVELPTRP